ncbi:long-chain fatty acid--CoA ligase [Occultella glacieicola]|uniref:Long-chain fatty acid--CoA ligase n=1 Tax=Occultella glacieicola TaxID=2518684 RepID=A0ABY2E078_9MICO|nr:AMP-binding protein [Occultella glacieicola]TDE89935.1 long-chain fatty acid--CoA ligase [Occultella glacieicola]
MSAASIDQWHTLGRWPAERAREAPDRIAIDDRGVPVSYGELERRATALARGLRAAGYVPGDRIATLTGNSADHVVLFFACAKAGLVLTPLSWRLAAREVADQLAIADAVLLLSDQTFEALARSAVARLRRPPATGELGTSGVEASVPAPSRNPAEVPQAVREVRDSDPLLLTFTSGTSARPKGVVLTHANCFWTNLSLSRTAPITPDDVVLAVMPQFHVGGWNVQPLLAWWTGATVVLEQTFEPARVLHLIAERRVSTMMGVPAHYLMLAEQATFADADLAALRLAIVGGAPMPEPLLRTWHARGVKLVQGYGLSEASPNVLCVPAALARDRLGWAGTAYPYVDVAVADPVTGEVLDGPATGELLVHGPGVFAGYFRDREATDRALQDGWLHTGDLVERDDEGFFRIVDRLSDMYISGGENVAPAEVEAVLRGHPAVADVAVVGEPDERWGEVGIAHVVLRRGIATDAQALIGHCRDDLAAYKVPKRIAFVAELPHTASGKTVRRELRTGATTQVPATTVPDPADPATARRAAQPRKEAHR